MKIMEKISDCQRLKKRARMNRQEVEDFYGEGNGTPLQYSCLENPMGGGAW